MTAMLPSQGSQFMPSPMPRSGILLNASPCSSAPSSPKRSTFPLGPFSSSAGPHSLSSQSSNSSTSSSTDDIVSNTSATSATAPSTSSPYPNGASIGSRKIRFAPLPERDDQGVEIDCLPQRQHVQNLFNAPKEPFVIPPTPTHSDSAGSNLASCSTLGLSLDGRDPPDNGLSTETNTIAGSDCGTDDTHTALPKKKGSRWSRLLRLPRSSSSNRSSDESGSSGFLGRTQSRESTGNASVCSLRTMSEGNESSASFGSPSGFSIRSLTHKSATSESGPTTGPPLRKGRAYSVGATPSTVRKPTLLLNGRVYGGPRRPQSSGGNPFANVRDEPEFVEWGHGGMGSVHNSSHTGEHNRYAALQSNQKLSVGHVEGGSIGDDEDDGSGLGWVKRRKEQREREKREREEREAKEKEESEKQAKDTNVGGVKNGESGDSVEKLSKNELPTSPSVVEADV